MSLTITEVTSPGELDAFVEFPWAVYADFPLWVPPLKKDDRELLTPGKHPFWETAERALFLARRGEKVVGRIAAIVDHKANDYSGEKCGAFGFFECLPDPEAAQALLAQAYDWLKARGMEFMRGPLSPSTNYTCALLVDGFDEPPALMMPWNPPAYARYFEKFHMRKEQDLFAYRIDKDRLDFPDWLDEEIKRLKEKRDFTFRCSSKKTLDEDARIMLDLYRKSWAQNFAFSPLSTGEEEALAKELVTYLEPEFFVLYFHEGKPAAGMLALPDYTPLLKRMDGRLNLMAPWHYFRTRKTIHEGYRIILFGILEQYRLLGLPLLLLDYMLEKARAKPDLRWVEGSWVLEDNKAVDDLIEDFSGKISKRYRIYRKDIL